MIKKLVAILFLGLIIVSCAASERECVHRGVHWSDEQDRWVPNDECIYGYR